MHWRENRDGDDDALEMVSSFVAVSIKVVANESFSVGRGLRLGLFVEIGVEEMNGVTVVLVARTYRM